MKEIVVIDEIFPQVNSGYRFPEFNYYLENIPECRIFSGAVGPNSVCHTTGLEKKLEVYFNKYPQYKNRVITLEKDYISTLDVRCFYTIFLIQAFNNIDLFERMGRPFVFTLYPGGGMTFTHNPMLSRVLNSPMLKYAITTQMKTKEYVEMSYPHLKDKIKHIYGGPVNVYNTSNKSVNYGKLNVCFVSHKNGQNGSDKGYPQFVELAKLISKDHFCHFHVVGGFTPKDVDVSTISDRITFYGIQPEGFFRRFYHDMDIIISPINGGYDTTDVFMNGSTVEATLAGVAAFISDPNKQAKHLSYKDGEDLVIMEGTIADAYNKIKDYFDPMRVHNMGISGSKVSLDYFNLNTQMVPRVELLLE